jgi:hypothetical protein
MKILQQVASFEQSHEAIMPILKLFRREDDGKL